MKFLKKLHPGYTAVESRQYFGEFQYVYSCGRYEISLISIFVGTGWTWELYQTEGEHKLFEDVDRYHSKMNAQLAAIHYLIEGMYHDVTCRT